VGIFVFFMAFLTNRDPLHYGPLTIPGESAKDLSGDTMRFFIDPWLAFFVGRALFKTSRDLRDLCRILIIAFLAYSLLILFEIRMSPNLNYWIYGFSAGRFDMTIRWGGYRPTVFFKDGLTLAAFVVVCALTAAAMARARMRVFGVSMKFVCWYAVVILVACKSTGAIGYGLLAVPLIYFLPPRTAYRVARVLALCFLIYPALRLLNLISMQQVADLFRSVSADRAESLLYRFGMEQDLLEHAKQRLLWGWGDWGRNLIYDPGTGVQTSIPDGGVVIMLGSHGLIGFYSYYIPFVYTIMRAGKYLRRMESKIDRALLAALALNCGITLFDLIINSFFTPLHMILFGALYSLPASIVAEEAAARETAAESQEGFQSFRLPVTVQRP
jgi:hypothetical protein